jgi:hypothetical protein
MLPAGSANIKISFLLTSTCKWREEHTVRSRRHKDDLRVRRLGHLLHRLQVPDLHSRRRAQNIRSLAHKLSRLDLGARRDDLGLSGTLALRRHAERLLQVLAEDEVLDEDALAGRTPAAGGLLDDLADRLGNFLAALDHVLEHTGADHVAEGGLGALDQGLADVGDAEGGFVGGGDVVVDDGGELQVDVVFGHADLLGDLCGIALAVMRVSVACGCQHLPTIWILTST